MCLTAAFEQLNVDLRLVVMTESQSDFRHHHNERIFCDTGVIDENTQVAKGLDGKLYQCFCLFEIRYIRLKGSRFPARFLDLFHHFVGGLRGLVVIHNHCCATGCKFQSHGASDAA